MKKVHNKINLKTDKQDNPHGKTRGQPVTGGILYRRDSAGFCVSTSNKLSCNLTGQCFEIGNKNIPPNRYVAFNFEMLVLRIQNEYSK